jgi:hypothetical protein
LCLQGSALADLQAYLTLLVTLAGQGCLLDGINTAHWPATVSSSSSSRTLAQVWGRPPEQQQQQGQQRQGPGAALSLPCVSELLTVLLAVPTAEDTLPPHEQLLIEFVAKVITACSGLAAVPAAAAGAGSPTARPNEAAAAVPEGYSSPGLLHMLFSTHLRLVLEASSDKGTPVAHTRAVNALHLIRCILQQPGLQQQEHLQLLLPCLARPLAKQLTSASSCQAVQRQVLMLLQSLLCGPGGQQLLPQLQQAAAEGDAGGSAISFRYGS